MQFSFHRLTNQKIWFFFCVYNQQFWYAYTCVGTVYAVVDIFMMTTYIDRIYYSRRTRTLWSVLVCSISVDWFTNTIYKPLSRLRTMCLSWRSSFRFHYGFKNVNSNVDDITATGQYIYFRDISFKAHVQIIFFKNTVNKAATGRKIFSLFDDADQT